ncbi:MAG: sugar diacid utilization regulator, partial [Glaciecola sp.]
FDDSEVALLSSLASHAAAAIDNARLYDSLRETASELEVANIDLRDKVAAIDRAATLHEQLTGIVVRGGGVAEVLAALSNVLGDDVVFRLPEDLDEVVAEALGGRGGRVVRGTRVVATEGRPTTTVPVLVGEDVLAWLLVERDLSASDADLRQLERAALVMALVLVRDRALRAAELRSRHELVAALLRDEGSPESLQRRALAAGLRPARAHVVVVFAQEDGGAAAAAAEGVVVEFGGIASEFERAAVAIVEASDEGEVAAWIRREQRGLAGTAGVANAAPGIASLGAAHGEAKRCVAAAATLGRQGDVVAPADLGVYRFLLGSSEASETAQFIARILAPLDEADQVRRTELVATVEAYLVSGRHHSATAEALHIHPNTLYQRLARIDEVLGDDWREAERSLELQLALRLRTMTTALTEAAGS